MFKSLFVCILIVVVPNVIVGMPLWGIVGHQATAAIAESLITSNVQSKVSSILGGQTLVQVADWADKIKSDPSWAWSKPLHYINTPDWACDFVHTRDCGDNVCVQGAIANYSQRLATESGQEQQYALQFLTHFAGDIHQPLHVGFGSDRGGNSITGTFNGYNDNLHSLWDTWIINERMKNDFDGSQNKYTDYLVNQVKGVWAQNATEWAKCSEVQCADSWATVSADLACRYAYTDSQGNHIKNGFDLGTPYYDYTKDIVDEQLAKGGVRLAMMLNKILGGDSKVLLPLPLPANDL